MIIRRIVVPKNGSLLNNENEIEYKLAVPIEVQDGLTGNNLTVAVILALNEKLKEALEPEVTIQYERAKELVEQYQ